LPYKQRKSGKIDLYLRTVLQLYPLITGFLIANAEYFSYNVHVQLLSLQEIICILFFNKRI